MGSSSGFKVVQVFQDARFQSCLGDSDSRVAKLFERASVMLGSSERIVTFITDSLDSFGFSSDCCVCCCSCVETANEANPAWPLDWCARVEDRFYVGTDESFNFYPHSSISRSHRGSMRSCLTNLLNESATDSPPPAWRIVRVEIEMLLMRFTQLGKQIAESSSEIVNSLGFHAVAIALESSRAAKASDFYPKPANETLKFVTGHFGRIGGKDEVVVRCASFLCFKSPAVREIRDVSS